MRDPSLEQAEAALADVSDRLDVRRFEESSLPALPALRPVLPGLRRGQVVTVDGVGALALALMAGPSQAGSWCAVVGVPDLGVPAASGMGCDPERMLLIDEPGERWVDVVAALLGAVDVVLVCPPARAPSPVVRRLSALARTSGSCLVVAGAWEGAMARLRVESSLWTGVGQGHGHLRGRRVRVVAEGRGAGGRSRSAWLWLPGPDGSVRPADLVAVDGERTAAGAA
ncbi:hypothetical protein CLV30_1255 [Haloactinopolyspora alba]|uniref:Protein RecA n=1 Tax=Haloactinopolyspora alba TaxID=648780 RepID=A0A2P8DHD0_9ACTN|nr:hypothetical protein [Haloactinopolyspora alba]PSK96625.1 hypothetical protein CLV30_1255 [Haloactinopolyspora alba]